MLNIVYNVLFIVLGAYLIFCGHIAQGLVVSKPGADTTAGATDAAAGATDAAADAGAKPSIPHKELFISLMVIGVIIILVSVFNIYRSFKSV